MKLRSKIIIQLFVTNICAFNMVQPLIKEYVTKIVENVVTFFVVNMVWPLIFALTTWLRLFFFHLHVRGVRFVAKERLRRRPEVRSACGGRPACREGDTPFVFAR